MDPTGAVPTKKSKERYILELLLWLGAAYHIALGFFAIFLKDTAVLFADKVFAFNLDVSDQLFWIFNLLGAYMLIFGVIFVYVAREPFRYKKMIYVLAAFIGIRVIQRIWFLLAADSSLQATSTFGIIVYIVVLAVYGSLLVILGRKVKYA